MEKESVVQIGGSIKSALEGEFNIDVQSILKEAWGKSLTSRLSINLGLLFIFFLALFISFITSSSLGGIEVVLANTETSLLLNVLVTLLIWPFMAGIEMMGVFHSVGIKTQTKLIFAFLRRGSWVAICALLTSLMISIGFQLLILPGIFLAVSLSLTIPLVVDKKLSPFQAIVLSIKVLRFQWIKTFSLYLILMLALMLSFLPLILLVQTEFAIIGIVFLFFGLSYIAPLYYNVKGILYREIFGLQLRTVEGGSLPSGSNDTFSA